MKNLSLILSIILVIFGIETGIAQKIAEVHVASQEVQLTRSEETYEAIAAAYLESGYVTGATIIHNEDFSEFYLVGSVAESSNGVRNIGVKLVNEEDEIFYDSGVKLVVKCIGDPCNNCDLQFQGLTEVICECIQDGCSTCRCNQVVETEISAGFSFPGSK